MKAMASSSSSSQFPLCLISFLCLVVGASALPDNNFSRTSRNFQLTWSGAHHLYAQISAGRYSAWDLLQVLAMCSVLPAYLFWMRWRRPGNKSLSTSSGDASENETVGQYPADLNGKSLISYQRFDANHG